MIVYSPDSPITLKCESDSPVYSVIPDEVVLDPGSSTPLIQKDANLSVKNAATILKNGQIQAQLGTFPEYESLNPLVASVGATGYVSRISDGIGRIKAVAGPDAQVIQVPVSLQDAEDVKTFVSWRSGSLAKFSTDRVNTLITGISATPATQDIYTGLSRNPSLFLAPYAASLTAVAYLVNGSPYMGFTAITTRHVVACAHIGDYSGFQISFMTAANVRVNKTLVKAYFVPNLDVAVYLLDSALPSSIAPMRLCPANLPVYLPNPQFQVPLVYPDRDQKMCIGCTASLTSSYVTISKFTDSRAEFYRTPETGTSGKPIILIYGSGSANMAIYGLFTYTFQGPALHALTWTSIIPALDASAGVSTGLQPVRASFAAFTAYP